VPHRRRAGVSSANSRGKSLLAAVALYSEYSSLGEAKASSHPYSQADRPRGSRHSLNARLLFTLAVVRLRHRVGPAPALQLSAATQRSAADKRQRHQWGSAHSTAQCRVVSKLPSPSRSSSAGGSAHAQLRCPPRSSPSTKARPYFSRASPSPGDATRLRSTLRLLSSAAESRQDARRVLAATETSTLPPYGGIPPYRNPRQGPLREMESPLPLCSEGYFPSSK